ncbi:MAG TPA: hypothetical protein VFW79_07010 [Cellulomonas sp.]|uniref:CBU_0592 family membrane protein n=1 Tax=Cellulomonas sp. TaxID=40001 RepID=UPI002E375F7A|nr:hypothetical protein [Cellulomonas sp.]HEX5332376.1 hypothetical protein [Cellulomonas sp.]
MHALVTAIGWIGAVTCVGAYGLVSRGTWSVSSRRFQVTNVAAALMMCIVAARGHVWASVAANLVWAVIGARTIATVMRARRAQTDVSSSCARASRSDGMRADLGDGRPGVAHGDLRDGASIEPIRVNVAVPELELSGMRASSVGLVA